MAPGKLDSSKCGRGMWDWERKRYSGYGSSRRGIHVKNELEHRIRTPRD